MKATKAALIVLLAGATVAHGAIARVQSKAANTSATNATSLPIVMDSTPTAGNVLVIAYTGGGTSNNDPRMSEQAGITWQIYQNHNSTSGTGGIAFGRVAAGIASSTVTLACTSSQPLAAIAVEYSGTNIRSDKQIAATGSSTTAATGATSEATNNANELWFASVSCRSNANVPVFSSPVLAGTGGTAAFVAQTNTNNAGSNLDRDIAAIERIVTATGSPNASATMSSTNQWNALLMTFEETPSSSSTGDTKIPSIGMNLYNWLKRTAGVILTHR